MRVLLITGFLGSGKTSFIKSLIPRLGNRRVALIINEFGKEGVDGALLRAYGQTLSEITNGSIFCSCRMDQFQAALVMARDEGADTVVVESSGLSDPSAMSAALNLPGAGDCEYLGCVCMVDAVRFIKAYEGVRAAARQTACADLFIINKTDVAAPAQMRDVLALLAAVRPGADICHTSFGAVSDDIWGRLCAMRPGPCPSADTRQDLTLRRYQISVEGDMRADDLRALLAAIAGRCLRVKGFARTDEGLLLADCVGDDISVARAESAGVGDDGRPTSLTVLSVAGMDTAKWLKAALGSVCEGYAWRVD